MYSTLRVLVIGDEKFNGSHQTTQIDHIIESQILQERFAITVMENNLLSALEYMDLNTREIRWKDRICLKTDFNQEFEAIMKTHEQKDNAFITITKKESHEYRGKSKTVVNIFGCKKLVNELIRRLEDLFKEHRLRKFQFTQVSSTDVGLHFYSPITRTIPCRFESVLEGEGGMHFFNWIYPLAKSILSHSFRSNACFSCAGAS